MRTCLKNVSLGGFLCCVALVARAATSDAGDYLIDVWTGEKGLPNSSVTSIAQTPDGYLWVGTYNGLARFDGQRFVKFDPDNTPALRGARVRRLFTDPTGTLWVNTYDGSLTSYRDGQFQLEWTGGGSADANVAFVSARSNRPTFLLHTGEIIRRHALTEDPGTNQWETLRPPGASTGELCVEARDGTLWLRGRDQKLWRLNGATFEAVATNSGLQGQAINCLQADRDGRIWVGTEKELAVWDGARFQTMTPTNGEPALNVGFLYFAPDGEVWTVANDRVRKARGREWVLEVNEFRGLFTTGFDRLGVQADRNGGAWFYHYGRGIFHVRADGRTRPMTSEENFPGEKVDCFYEDKEGNLWAGVDRGGLVRLREKRFAVLVAGDGAAAKAAVSVAEDRSGDIWIGTYGAGLLRGQGSEWGNLSLVGGAKGRGFVFSVCPDAEDRLWMSAGEEDLYVRSNGVVRAVTPAVHGVKALLAARDGRVWIGTKSSLSCWTRGQVRQFQPEDGIARNDVRALAEDASGAIWAGAGDGTLYRVASNHVNSYRSEDQWAAQPIWSLLADADGTVWVGTFRGGLLRFRDGKFTRYTSQHGLPDDVICSILEDGNGRLWIGSPQGIFQVTKVELNDFANGKTKHINCTAYGRYDGLPSLECSGSYQPSAWRASDGRLLFATLRGVVSVQPGDLAPNRLPPPVVIEEALVDGQSQVPGRITRSPRGAGKTVTVLEVPPGKRQVEFHFTGLSFVSPDRVRFRYKLDGLDRDWIEAGTRRSAQYSFLRPGRYDFRVIACNNDGVWNDDGASLALVVQPLFYESWWFVPLVALLGVVAVVLAVRQIFVRRLRKKLEAVERQRAIERDRARIAKDIHDDLGAGLTHISLLSELARRDSPQQVTNHVGQISDTARELTRTMDEIVWAVDPQNDSLDSLVTYVSKFAQEYLTVAGIRCRLDVPAELPPYALPAEVRHNLFLAIKEALNNIVKHAQATEVWLRLLVKPGAFTVTIEDNGRGLAASNGDGGAARRNGRISSGHGLGNLEKRLTASGGRCVVTSEPGAGTRVEMTVHLSGVRSPELVTGTSAATR